MIWFCPSSSTAMALSCCCKSTLWFPLAHRPRPGPTWQGPCQVGKTFASRGSLRAVRYVSQGHLLASKHAAHVVHLQGGKQ